MVLLVSSHLTNLQVVIRFNLLLFQMIVYHLKYLKILQEKIKGFLRVSKNLYTFDQEQGWHLLMYHLNRFEQSMSQCLKALALIAHLTHQAVFVILRKPYQFADRIKIFCD